MGSRIYLSSKEPPRLEIHFSGLKPHHGTTIFIVIDGKKQEFLREDVGHSIEVRTNADSSLIHHIHL